uniref:Rab-GAP TBC domain-containing protein n=1 Tax=Propithecus coquereli TaxID=379532 RepID=A0A2K6EII8_PROCO
LGVKVIYEQEGVYIHSSCGKTNDQDSLISGILCVLEKDAEVIVDWRPLDEALDSSSIFYAGKDSSSVVEWTQAPKERWDMVSTVSFKKKQHTNGDAPSHRNGKSKWSLLFSLTDLKSIKKNKEGMGWSYLVLCLKDDVVLPALHFHQRDRTLLVNCQNKSLSQSFENLLDEPDPYIATIGVFSKVTNYIFDSLRGSDPSTHQRPPSEMADFLSDAIPGLKINQQEEPGFENIDSEGRILNVDNMKQMIFRGGLSHALRKQAWKFLLGYFPWDSAKEERIQLQKQKNDEYFRMKPQWKSVSEEQEKRNSRLRDYRSLIEKDVNRTDRTIKFYEGQDNPGLILLHDILITYCMYDFDLGYVRGMSDLLSSLLYVMENEVDAFWCFASYMDQMHQNFEEQMQGMKTQLIQLNTLHRLLDSGFCSYLESQDSGYLYFCFRWLLIRFKREFHFLDNLQLREVMWTELPCKNFHLLCCQIMEKHYDTLCKAEAVSLQMVKCKELPQILGLQDSEVTTPDSDIGEDENFGMTHPTSVFQSNTLPILTSSGARDDNPTQIAVSSDVSRLTPA